MLIIFCSIFLTDEVIYWRNKVEHDTVSTGIVFFFFLQICLLWNNYGIDDETFAGNLLF